MDDLCYCPDCMDDAKLIEDIFKATKPLSDAITDEINQEVIKQIMITVVKADPPEDEQEEFNALVNAGNRDE